jgi:membrane associated rhomboid family serine protease
MLIPIRHENMSARRWPVVTFALIAINVITFLFTYQPLQDQQKQLGQLKLHVALLAAAHPELNTPSATQELVRSLRDHYPKDWVQLQNPHRHSLDAWDARMLQTQDPGSLQSEMDALSAHLQQARAASIVENYAFVPAHPNALSYLTANFLHGGWLHLIGNMWFLWLAGFVLEDFWGRSLYSAFYLIAGAAALQFHAWLNPGSTVPTLGASGAVAALMGAFLVRFPKMRIEMLWWMIVRFRFKAPAYWLLPAWLFMEIFYGSVFGQATGIAHWAHVGGFAFGALAALGLRYSGLESKANQQIEAELTLESDPEIKQASELIDHGQRDRAATLLTGYLSKNPDSVDACNLLRLIYQQRNDLPACQQILARLCAIHLKAGETELVWKSYEDFIRAGGEKLPAATWLDVGRAAEKLDCFDRAAGEYEKLAAAYPTEKQSILAQLGAARVYLKRLNQPERALDFLYAAARSPVPHLDWEQSIVAEIREAKAVLSQKAASATASSQR